MEYLVYCYLLLHNGPDVVCYIWVVLPLLEGLNIRFDFPYVLQNLVLSTATVKGHLLFLSDIVEEQYVRYTSRMVPYGSLSFQVSFLGYQNSSCIAVQY